ncbi:MAG TPA: GrpB family protein [Streptosporangiaceae bacterium]|nr:GrpB family protein [Streptosporangiaceae bacterium]
MSVVVVTYRTDWPERAAGLAATLRGRLGGLAERVEHIGSTSIPGMAAKDLLDMQVSVPDLDEAAVAFGGPLSELGFERRPYNHDHVPAGLDDDRERWAKRYWRRRGHGDDVNLHVRRTGSPNERLALLFRDWFRAHPGAVAGYALFKTELSAVVPDVDAYTDIKDPVVDVVIVAAEEWAAATGWRPWPGVTGPGCRTGA